MYIYIYIYIQIRQNGTNKDPNFQGSCTQNRPWKRQKSVQKGTLTRDLIFDVSRGSQKIPGASKKTSRNARVDIFIENGRFQKSIFGSMETPGGSKITLLSIGWDASPPKMDSGREPNKNIKNQRFFDRKMITF